jgi:uncharacterized repeat protein (TIGR01451 family)
VAHRFRHKVQARREVAGLVALVAANFAAPPTTAQETRPERGREPTALVVESSLERLAPNEQGGFDTSIVRDVGAAASHADQLIYSARFTNRSQQLLDGVRITSPIPANLRYVPSSATGPASTVLFSVDNARTFGLPEELRVASPSGESRAADAADYTHVRWILEGALDVGAAGVVRFGAVPR